MNNELSLTFSVQGWVRQTVKITDPNYSQEQIVEMLSKGTAITTIQEDGTIDITATGHPIANVVNVDNECEYSDFAKE